MPRLTASVISTKNMTKSKISSESGVLNLGDKFISVRLIKDALEKYNRIAVFEENSDFIKCRIFRIGRIFGGPWLGPYPSVSFQIERNDKETLLHYNYSWPEYSFVSIGSFLLGIAVGTATYSDTSSVLAGMKYGIFVFLVSALVSLTAIFWDVSYYKRLLRKELIKK